MRGTVGRVVTFAVVTGFVALFALPFAWSAARRREWSAVLAAALFLGVMAYMASTAHAAVRINGPWWAQRAVDRMRVPVAPDQTLLLEPCPGWPQLAACNFPTPDSPVYIPRVYYTRVALYRELGGRFGTLAMTPGARLRFAVLIRRPRDHWAMAASPTGLWGLADVFEDAYADCALGLMPHRVTLQRPESDRWVDENGVYYLPRRVHARVCALIARLGARAGFEIPAASAP